MPTSAAATAARGQLGPSRSGLRRGLRGNDLVAGSGPRSAPSASAATPRFTATAIQMVTLTPRDGTSRNPASAVPSTAPHVLIA